MQDLLYVFSEFFGTLRDVDAISPHLVLLIGIFSAAGALILTRFTGTLGGMSLLINGSALFIGAILTNWLFQHVKLPVNSPIEGPLFMSLIGMTLASAPMLWWMQGDGARN
jgi:hypothetical protein